MLDLSYLVGTSPTQPDHAAHSIALDDLDAAYLDYQQRALSHDPNAALMTREAFNNYSLDDSWLANIKQLAKRTVQTCRLMIGIQDYDYYLNHMLSQHPEATPYTRDEFYRYCLEARFPSADSKGTRCPC
jgi:uncharacterized short protein YbdD (DUF466 family)